MLSKAKSAIKKVASAITDGLKSIPSKLGSIGRNIVEGLWKGISNATGWIKNKVGGFAKGILKGMKDALKIKSPSRAFRDEVGRYIAEGVGVGITDNEASALNAVDQLSEDMITQAQKINGVTLKRQLETTFNGSVTSDNNIVGKLDDIIEKLKLGSQIVLDTGVLVGETVKQYDNALSNRKTQVARGWS
jgi:phage-related protein